MFQAVHVPILGIIENMSTFSCPHCGKGTDVFGKGGGEWMSRRPVFRSSVRSRLRQTSWSVATKDAQLSLTSLVLWRPQAYLTAAAELSGQLEDLPVSTIRPFVWTWGTDEGAPAWAENALQASGSRTTPIGFRRRDPRTLSMLWEDGRRDNLDVRDSGWPATAPVASRRLADDHGSIQRPCGATWLHGRSRAWVTMPSGSTGTTATTPGSTRMSTSERSAKATSQGRPGMSEVVQPSYQGRDGAGRGVASNAPLFGWMSGRQASNCWAGLRARSCRGRSR